MMKLAIESDHESQAEADAARTLSGQGKLMEELSQHPVAVEQRKPPRGMDHVFLARYVGTDLVQWQGRRSDGRFYAFGALMRIVP
jgi:hypothetical protein